MTKEELEQEKCELLGIIQGKDEAIADLKNKLVEAKQIISRLLKSCRSYPESNLEWIEKAEEFLKEEACEFAILKTTILKLRNCENCKYHSFWGDELKCNYGLKEALCEDKLVECHNLDKWEMNE